MLWWQQIAKRALKPPAMQALLDLVQGSASLFIRALAAHRLIVEFDRHKEKYTPQVLFHAYHFVLDKDFKALEFTSPKAYCVPLGGTAIRIKTQQQRDNKRRRDLVKCLEEIKSILGNAYLFDHAKEPIATDPPRPPKRWLHLLYSTLRSFQKQSERTAGPSPPPGLALAFRDHVSRPGLHRLTSHQRSSQSHPW